MGGHAMALMLVSIQFGELVSVRVTVGWDRAEKLHARREALRIQPGVLEIRLVVNQYARW